MTVSVKKTLLDTLPQDQPLVIFVGKVQGKWKKRFLGRRHALHLKIFILAHTSRQMEKVSRKSKNLD